MPQIHFEGLMQSLTRLPQVLQAIPDVLRDPASNPLQAAILLSMAVVVVLVVLLSVVLIIMRPSREEEEELYGAAAAGAAGTAAGTGVDREASTPMSWLTVTSIIVLVLVAVWVTAGITTASPDVCTSCHFDTKHSAAKVDDPHKSVPCISCHESGGPVARATVNLATRFQHVLFARADSDFAGAYGGPVASDACVRCHASQIAGTFYDRQRAVRMSHKEPIAAGASCVDCHVLTSGVVGATTVGMSPCLRCHNGKQAKAECSVCHIGDPSRAIQPSVAPGAMASVQVPNPQCSGCHKDMTKCNACHGISMPHSEEFKAYGHARAAAINIWFGNGQQCAKCHYPGHNYCLQEGCHSFPIAAGHPNPAWATLHQLTPWKNGSQTACSCHKWNPWDHNGMIYCQICHPTKPANAVP
ncbi:MAG: cytochrome c3 family protein [Coriobacteriia bacterium]|nr:cytochrome c3 family protein [Coriobacteriia bacterium]